MDGKDALQRQLSAAKVGSSSGAGKEQSVLSLMMEVEDLKTKVRREAVLCGATAMKVTRFGFAAVQGRGGASSRRWKLKEGGGVRGVDEEVSVRAHFTRHLVTCSAGTSTSRPRKRRARRRRWTSPRSRRSRSRGKGLLWALALLLRTRCLTRVQVPRKDCGA
jgi:hypothetical protein